MFRLESTTFLGDVRCPKRLRRCLGALESRGARAFGLKRRVHSEAFPVGSKRPS